MSDLRTVSPDELPVLSEIPEDLHAVVFSTAGPLQSVPYERLLTKLIAANLAKPTKAAIDADLAHPADSVALVFGDPAVALNGWYRKLGASGAGGWEQFEELARNSRLAAQAAAAAAQAALDGAAGVAAAQVTAVNNAGAAQVSAINAAGEIVGDRAEAAAAAAAGVVAAGYFGSLQFADENNEIQSLEHSTQLYLDGSRNGGARWITSNDANAMWAGPSTLAIMWECPVVQYNTWRRQPRLIGTDTTGGNQSFSLGYRTRAENPGFGYFEFGIRGTAAASATWACVSPAIPNSATRLLIAVRQDDANMALDVIDLATGTKYAGTPVAKPAGWLGMRSSLFDVCIGAPRNSATPVFPGLWNGGPGTGPQVNPSPRGSVADALIADRFVSDTDLLAIYRDGADAVTTVGLEDTRLYAPLTNANGVLDMTVRSHLPAVDGDSLTLVGKALPGPTFRRRSTGAIVLDPIPYPGYSALEYEAQSAYLSWPATITGLTAPLGQAQFRMVTEEGSSTDWMPCEYLLVTAVPTFRFQLPAAMEVKHQLQVRFSNHPSAVGATHSQMVVGDHIWALAQSEGNFTVDREVITSGTLELTLPADRPARIEQDLSTVWFRQIDGRLWGSAFRAGALGTTMVTIGNYIRRRTQRPVLFACQMVAGTSIQDLFSDSHPNGVRDWNTEAVAHSFVINRRPDGRIPMTGMIKIGWEASDNQIAYGRDVMFPSYRGRFERDTTYIWPWGIDHFIHDGTFSQNMKCVELPCNRLAGGSGMAGLADGYLSEADQRDSMINWGHILGYEVGPSTTDHRMDGTEPLPETGGAGTHPRPNVWDGALMQSYAFAESACIIMGFRSYPGVVRYEQIMAHPTDPKKAILTLGPPRRFPGFGLANPDLYYRRDPEPWTPAAAGIKLRTHSADGDPKYAFEVRRTNADAWSVLGLVSAEFVGNDTCVIEFAENIVPGQTRVRHKPGGPGNYPAASLTQDLWRKSQHYFTGDYFAPGREPGFEVTGSNFELVVPA